MRCMSRREIDFDGPIVWSSQIYFKHLQSEGGWTRSSYLVSPVSFLKANPKSAIFFRATVLNMAPMIRFVNRSFWYSFISITWIYYGDVHYRGVINISFNLALGCFAKNKWSAYFVLGISSINASGILNSETFKIIKEIISRLHIIKTVT